MISLTVIGLFIIGTGIGILFRTNQKFLKTIESLVSLAVFALLFFLGISVGSDPRIVQNVSVLGWQAIALSSGAILGSILLAKLFGSFFRDENEPSNSLPRPETALGDKILKILKSQSLWILLFFTAGIFGAIWEVLPGFWGDDAVSTGTLYVLMVLVGAGIGADPRALEIIRQTSIRIAIVPVIVIAGSLSGSWLVSFLISDVGPANGMAVGAGFGYYSLSAIIIGKVSGSEMGVIALLANIFREVVTLIGAPFMVRWFGKLGAIASGGATAMDTTLPVIIGATGKEYAVISIFSGIVLSVLVPILVPLLLGS